MSTTASRADRCGGDRQSGSIPEADVQAIANYVAAGMGSPIQERHAPSGCVWRRLGRTARRLPPGGRIRPSTESARPSSRRLLDLPRRRPRFAARRPELHLSTAVNAPNPQNIINVTLFGLPAAEGEPRPSCRASPVLIDETLAALLNHMRDRFSDQPAWTDTRERRATISGERRWASTAGRHDAGARKPE